MKKIISIFLLVSIFGCYTYPLLKEEGGNFINYKGAKKAVQKDDKNKMYFINEKGDKVYINLRINWIDKKDW
jgi:hypothetical protein